MTRDYLPNLTGTIQTRTGLHVNFQFIASGSALPFVVLTNHGLGADGKVEWDDRSVRFRFLIGPAGPDNRWQRNDAGEPSVDYADGSDVVPDALRTSLHDDCLDAWERYSDERPELVTYARLVEINNQIVQLDEKAAILEKQLAEVQGERKNLEALEARVRATLPPTATPLSTEESDTLNALVLDNCWLSLREGEDAELHPYNTPDVLRTVSSAAAQRLAVCGFIQLHRYLADNRTVFKIADRGREIVEGKS